MNGRSQSLVMLGPPASGKGTQGRLLAEKWGLSYMSTGSRLRQEIEKVTAIGLRAKVFLDAHEYVPDVLAIEMVSTWLGAQEQGWLLDGFPRSVPQAEALLSLVPRGLIVVDLQVPFEVLSDRVTKRQECPTCGPVAIEGLDACKLCGSQLIRRADDSTEGFQDRYQVYQNLTLPALVYLQSRCQVVEIDGAGSREEVATRIEQSLS